MRGLIQKRGTGSWRIRAYLGRDASGTKRYVTKTVRGTRRDAERDLSRLLVEVDEGRHSASAPMTFGDLLDRWLTVKRQAVEPTTLSSYDWVARTYLRPALGDRKVAALRPIELDDLYADLSARGLSPRTVRICHTVIRQSLEQARRWGLIARSPAVDATPPRQVRKEVTPPTVEQVRALVDAAREEDPEFATYLWVLAATGCRRGEACALRWTDVDLDRGQLRIRRSIAHVDGGVYEKSTKTHQSRRLALDPATVDELRTQRRRMRERSLALGVALAPDAHIFSDLEGRPWRPDVCTNRFGRLRQSLGLDAVRLHDLRHFVATVLGDGGVPIATISSRLGHRDTATTLNIYTHALPATDQLAAAYLGSLLAPGSGVVRRV
ncbi:MAG: tyrosine-type recombinase/integrase [Microthrixaceae bacterium]